MNLYFEIVTPRCYETDCSGRYNEPTLTLSCWLADWAGYSKGSALGFEIYSISLDSAAHYIKPAFNIGQGTGCGGRFTMTVTNINR